MKTILFFLFIPFVLIAQKTDFLINQGSLLPNEYYEELPFEFLKGQIIINVSIEGKTYRFSLDTGAPTSVSNNLYKKLSTSKIGKLEIFDANNEKDSINVISLKSLKIGDITIKNTPALVLDSDNLLFKCLDIDGNIGSNSLRNSVVQFDYPNRKVRITNKVKNLNLERKSSQRMVLTSNQSCPLFWIRLVGDDKYKLQLLFDTGMEGLLDISLRHFSTLNNLEVFTKVKSASGNNSIGLFGITKDTLHYQFQIDRFRFGNMELKNATAKTTKSPSSRIGTDILKYAVVTLDYKKERIYFTPIKSDSQNAYKAKFPIDPNYKNGKYQVGFVWSPDKVPNIHAGDEILFVNDISCQEKSICELLLLMASIDENKIEIVTKGKDEKQYISTIMKE
ncbi:retropepsin-like aspartic protease [Saccharicrinis aurantiacus]|uniref:retropepsin-like aspartic protease n=1 Tax=Saccharicrinis aurantiacus TaxID=1849719 RepID=UPI00249273DB|nr:retropepsin-like aspartic protease [Saccharicrinis aurantiacus]